MKGVKRLVVQMYDLIVPVIWRKVICIIYVTFSSHIMQSILVSELMPLFPQ